MRTPILYSRAHLLTDGAFLKSPSVKELPVRMRESTRVGAKVTMFSGADKFGGWTRSPCQAAIAYFVVLPELFTLTLSVEHVVPRPGPLQFTAAVIKARSRDDLIQIYGQGTTSFPYNMTLQGYE